MVGTSFREYSRERRIPCAAFEISFLSSEISSILPRDSAARTSVCAVSYAIYQRDNSLVDRPICLMGARRETTTSAINNRVIILSLSSSSFVRAGVRPDKLFSRAWRRDNAIKRPLTARTRRRNNVIYMRLLDYFDKRRNDTLRSIIAPQLSRHTHVVTHTLFAELYRDSPPEEPGNIELKPNRTMAMVYFSMMQN